MGTLGRMSGILLRWLDEMPPHVVAIMTVSDLGALSSQWERRVDLGLSLDQPPLDGSGQESLEYRQAVFAALFRRFGLDKLAEETQFMRDLAYQTRPDQSRPPLPSPFARRCRQRPLADHRIWLRTGADIAHWIKETILLHCSDATLSDPETTRFWLDAI
jgi:hypothetical protein